MRIWILANEKMRFLESTKAKNEEYTDLVRLWISDYVEKHLEDLAAERLNEEVDRLEIKQTKKPTAQLMSSCLLNYIISLT